MADPASAPEFSRLVPTGSVDRRGYVQTIEATEAEGAALAVRFDLISVDRLTASIRLRPINGGTAIRLDAHLEAAVVQRCIVTLAPVPATLAEDFALVYSAEARADGDLDVAFDDEVMEPIEGDAIDVGEAVAQQLALALDPYPRAPGATPESLDGAPSGLSEDAPSRDGAFAALARWRDMAGRRDG